MCGGVPGPAATVCTTDTRVVRFRQVLTVCSTKLGSVCCTLFIMYYSKVSPSCSINRIPVLNIYLKRFIDQETNDLYLLLYSILYYMFISSSASTILLVFVNK